MIYLDNSATTRPFDSVCDALAVASKEEYYNISSPYASALKTEKALMQSIKVIAKSINASEKEIIFTSGGSESDNTALLCVPDNTEVIVSAYEHHGILNMEEPLRKKGCKLVLCPPDENGIVTWDNLAPLINEKTSLVSIMHVNNEIGAINDIESLCRNVKAVNKKILFHSDGVQSYMHVLTDMKKLGVDMFSISGHKVHGPKGIGLLYVKSGTPFVPFVNGGGQQDNRRSGTVNVPAIIAFGKAIEELESYEKVSQYLNTIKQEYVRLLTAIPDTKLICRNSAPNILSICFKGVKASSLQNALENEVIIGKGSACTSRSSKISHVLESIGLDVPTAESTVRISFGVFNTPEEIPVACEAIEKAVTYLRKYKRK